MILYNVTISIESSIQQDWLQWMKDIHIPEVMGTGYFTESKICKLLVDDEITYAIQYTCKNMNDLEEYQKNHAVKLQEKHSKRYIGKFSAFRTLLEVVHHH